MSLTRELVRLIRNRPVNQGDLDAAALFTLDAVANIMAGRNSDPGRRLLAWARATGVSSGNARDLAFLWGGLCHILEVDDLHRASVVHPGCVVVPAVWAHLTASGDGSMREVTGEKVLTAILHGFEATTRVGMAVGPAHYKIWHNTATCGAFGSAMAIATLLNLSEDQCVHALGNAGTQAAGLWEFLDSGAMSKHLHAGHAAQSGLTSAQLAAVDFTGPATILEGDRGFFKAACPDAAPALVTANPDADWQLALTSIKPWPSCRHTHPAIGAAIDLRRALRAFGAGVEDIASLRATTYPAALALCDRPVVDTVYSAKFSLQHCIAAALSVDVVDFGAFEEPTREALLPLRSRISLRTEDRYSARYPENWSCGLEATLRDNRTISAECLDAKGDPASALTHSEMIDKATMLLRHAEVDDPQAVIGPVLEMARGAQLPPLLLHPEL